MIGRRNRNRSAVSRGGTNGYSLTHSLQPIRKAAVRRTAAAIRFDSIRFDPLS
jgi:hypothetical protein